MEPLADRLVMYGHPSSLDEIEWSWVERRLADAGTYWVVPAGSGHPQPRPVWGVWSDGRLHLSIGSPVVAAALGRDATVTIHLGSDVDVVIVEGVVTGRADTVDLLGAYNAKYEWDYSARDYGPLTTVAPTKVMAWRSEGWAGREGFRASGRWTFVDDA